jgi:hypothetical protein
MLPVVELMTDFMPISLLAEDASQASCARNTLQQRSKGFYESIEQHRITSEQLTGSDKGVSNGGLWLVGRCATKDSSCVSRLLSRLQKVQQREASERSV